MYDKHVVNFEIIYICRYYVSDWTHSSVTFVVIFCIYIGEMTSGGLPAVTYSEAPINNHQTLCGWAPLWMQLLLCSYVHAACLYVCVCRSTSVCPTIRWCRRGQTWRDCHRRGSWAADVGSRDPSPRLCWSSWQTPPSPHLNRHTRPEGWNTQAELTPASSETKDTT